MKLQNVNPYYISSRLKKWKVPKIIDIGPLTNKAVTLLSPFGSPTNNLPDG